MGTTSTATGNVEASESLDFDAIVIGAGVSGLYQLYKLHELGLRVRVFEAGSTWHWNRYPGARFDSESDTYGYSFSQELLDEWDWSERFAAQPKTERYLNYVADKFDLRCDIQFNSRVVAAQYRDETRRWELTLEDGVRLNNVWRDSPQTYLGVLVERFPNMLMVMGPQAGLGNFTRTAEYSVEWVTGLIRFATERGLRRIEATAAAVAEWTDHVLALGQGQLMNEIGSWMTGVNPNLQGRQKPRIMRYSGGPPAYREHSAYGLNQLRYDLRKLKGHSLLQRDGSRYAYRFTPKGVPGSAGCEPLLLAQALRRPGRALNRPTWSPVKGSSASLPQSGSTTGCPATIFRDPRNRQQSPSRSGFRRVEARRPCRSPNLRSGHPAIGKLRAAVG